MSTQLEPVEFYPEDIFDDLVNSEDHRITIEVPKNTDLIERLRKALSTYKMRNQFKYKDRIPSNARLSYDLVVDKSNPEVAKMTIALVRSGVITL